MFGIGRSRSSVARDTAGQAAALVAREHIPDLLDELILVHTGTERSVAVMSVRLSIVGAPDFEFDPRVEDLIHDGALVRLRRALRTSDRIGIVSRTEFAVILPMVSGPEQAELAALKLLRCFDQPIDTLDGPKALRIAIGIACSPLHGTQSAALVRCARAAGDVAARKEDSYHVFDAATGGVNGDSNDMEAALRRALYDNALALHYQPQLELGSGEVVAAEALARWTGADGKAISPATFIPLAERRGLMTSFTGWTLSAGMRELAGLRAAGLDLGMSINVSPVNLDEPDFPEVVAHCLDIWSVPANRVTLEITESTPMHDAAKVLPMFQRLKAVGVRLAIDDFGTGYSSLALLRQLPVDELKIDQQFVRGMLEVEANMQIVRAILALANNFGLQTVAEGVEDEATLGVLRDLGCTLAQGYWLSRPMPGDAFANWLTARRLTR